MQRPGGLAFVHRQQIRELLLHLGVIPEPRPPIGGAGSNSAAGKSATGPLLCFSAERLFGGATVIELGMVGAFQCRLGGLLLGPPGGACSKGRGGPAKPGEPLRGAPRPGPIRDLSTARATYYRSRDKGKKLKAIPKGLGGGSLCVHGGGDYACDSGEGGGDYAWAGGGDYAWTTPAVHSLIQIRALAPVCRCYIPCDLAKRGPIMRAPAQFPMDTVIYRG